jgi:Pyruvate/2-oxoacid:ferredoxin oxidoreductase delta subunit
MARCCVVYCDCAYTQIVPQAAKARIQKHLAESRIPYQFVTDLCELAARRDPQLSEMLKGRDVVIVACHARAVTGLLRAAGVDPAPTKVTVLNMRERSADEIIRGLPSAPASAHSEPQTLRRPRGTWKPWFPVIDYDRCRKCGQCVGFCLFGVYAAGEDGTVRVVQPANCKPDCPACARVCPHIAIIFPKFPDAPINGAEVTEDDVRSRAAQPDVSALPEGDLRALLRRRRKPESHAPSATGETARPDMPSNGPRLRPEDTRRA